MPLIRNTIIFLETGFFKNYKPGDSTYHALFQHAKDQEIILCASGLGLWEWRSQKVNQLEGVVNTIRNSLNKYFQESPIAETVLSREIYQYLPNWDSLYADSKPYVDGFALDNRIKVYLPIERHINGTWEAYFRGDPPFKSPKNKNDIPDAWILESARDALADEEHAGIENKFCICGDGEMKRALEELGFQSTDALSILKLLKQEAETAEVTPTQDEPPIRPTAINTNTRAFNSLDDVLNTAMNANIGEIYTKLLGFCHWLKAPGKQQLIQRVAGRGFDVRLVEACAVILSQEPYILIQDTGEHYLPRHKAICQEAANVVMPEILEILDGKQP